jgi:glycosyltransferase involved in cell wall biosynthesis
MIASGPPSSTRRPPTVSVIVANYNGAAYLTDSIRSACRQTLRDIEIIVSDDASTDQSIAIIQQLMAEDERIQLITSATNGGPGAARNKAISTASGRWIAVMDSDDFMHPARLETLVASANQDGADIVADDLLIFDSDHVADPSTLLKGKWARVPFWIDISAYVRVNHLYGPGPSLGYLKPVIRSGLLAGSPGPYDERLRIGEDYNLIVRLLLRGAKYRIYPELSYFYRKHPSSISHRLNKDVLTTLKNADLVLFRGTPNTDRKLSAVIRARFQSIETALVFETLLDSLKTKSYFNALRTICADPRVLYLLKFPIVARLSRLGRLATKHKPPRRAARQICVLSRQRVVGRTNGSSVYLLELVTALAARGMQVHFLSPSPKTLGRWPFLLLSEDVSVFSTYRVRGTWRYGTCLISKNPQRAIQASLALLDKIFLNAGILSTPLFRRAPYSIAQSLTREDQLFIARHAPLKGDYLIADYCFLTDALPYALRPDARSAVIMHDLFSSRTNQFEAVGAKDSVVVLSEDEECAKLAQADCILAIQPEEAALIEKRLPGHRVILVQMAATPIAKAQGGDNDLILFVGSSAAANVDGLRWFLETCWPRIRAQVPDARFFVAGTVSHAFGPPPRGVTFMGLVGDLAPLYRQAGVVISPLRVGSGLKIKLLEALEHGKAVVATSTTLQGVTAQLSDAVQVADDAERFAAAVISLLNNEAFRTTLAARGLNALVRHFSADQCYGAFVTDVAAHGHYQIDGGHKAGGRTAIHSSSIE